MGNTVSVVKFELPKVGVTVSVEVKARICVPVVLLHAMWRYDGSICFFAVVDGDHELFPCACLPEDVTFTCACDGSFILFNATDAVWGDELEEVDDGLVISDRGVGAYVIL